MRGCHWCRPAPRNSIMNIRKTLAAVALVATSVLGGALGDGAGNGQRRRPDLVAVDARCQHDYAEHRHVP